MFKWLILYLTVLCAGIPLWAQRPLLRHYTLQDGLPSNVIYDVYQDSRGFIWFCTDQGVSRFDGSVFRNYTIDDGLPDNEVFRIREDGQHRYWLICYNKAACYVLDDKVYSSANDALCRKVEQLGIAYDEMFCSVDGSYCLVGEKIGKLSVTPPYISLWPHVKLPPARVFYFRKAAQEYLVFGAECRNLTTGQSYLFGREGLSVACYDDNSGRLFVSRPLSYSRGEILEQWSLDGHGMRRQHAVTLPSTVRQLTIRQGKVVACTEKGIVVYDPDADLFREDTVFPRDVRSNLMLTDREGNDWLITLNKGVYFRSKNNYGIINTQSGLSGNNILSLYCSADGTLVAGDEHGYVNLIGSRGIKKICLTGDDDNNRIVFVKDINARTMFAGGDHGLYKAGRNGQASSLISFASMKAGLLHDGHFWAGSSLGLHLYDTLTGRAAMLSQMRIVAMAKDPHNIIWAAITQGVIYYKDQKQYAYSRDTQLNQSRITCMVTDAKGQVLMGTSTRGLFIVKGPSLSPRHLQQRDGLSSNNCKKLFCGTDGVVWLCSERGVDRLVPDRAGNYRIVPFPLPDIVSGNKINDLVEKNGQLYLATAEGIVTLDSRNADMAQPPQLFFDAVNGNTLPLTPQDTSLVFAYGARDIQVSYIGLSFSGGSKQQYRYLLTGGTGDTLYTDARSVNFSAMSPGKYEMLLWARNIGGSWSADPVRLAFVIRPPFWMHPLFVGTCSLLSLAGAALIYRARLKVVHQRAEQKIRYRQQLAELEMKALRAQINPHFIFNALNSIQAYYSQNDELSANHYMTSFARFIRLTLVHAQAHWLPLGTETDMLRTYMELEQMRFKDLFTFTITYGQGTEPERIAVPAMLIQPYVENAINHGLRHLKNRKGLLSLRFSIRQDTLLCEVDDNGVGRSYTASRRRNGHTSLGMTITQERVDTINRMYNINVRVVMIDKHDDNGIARGTLIRLFIPLQKQRHHAEHHPD